MPKVFRDGLEENADGPITVSNTVEGHKVETYTVGGQKRFFVTLANTPYCAHGDTLPEAITDALWKDESKRPSMEAVKESIQKDGEERKITLTEFRILTGACAAGCKSALRQAGLDGSPMTAKQIKKYFPEWGQKLLSVLKW